MTNVCPFCGLDPYEWVNVGIGSVPVAVTCCDLGWYYFDGGEKYTHQGMPYEDVLQIQKNMDREGKKALLVAEGVYPLIDGEYTGGTPLRQIGYPVEEGPMKLKDHVDEIPFQFATPIDSGATGHPCV